MSSMNKLVGKTFGEVNLHRKDRVFPLTAVNSSVVVVVVRLEHSHSFIDSFDNHYTASGPASCRRRRPPGNAVSGHSSTLCLVVWWLSPQGQAGDTITPHR